MRVKLYEAKWKHIIEGELADNFHNTIDASDVEGAIAASVALLEKCKEFFDPEEDEYVIYEIEDLIESFNDVDRDDVDSVDYLLDELYDFCDGYNIFIGFGESEWNNLEPGVEEEPAEQEEMPVEEPAPVEEPQEEALDEEKETAIFGYTQSKLDAMSLDELNSLMTDVINDREGQPEVSKKGLKLDDLYSMVDAAIQKKNQQ